MPADSANNNRHALPPGTFVGGYRIEQVLGQGGFGITYLAHHLGLDRQVALKELFPIDLAVRGGDGTVTARSDDTELDFEWALRRFVQEARHAVKCKHPNIVEVFDVFEANGTAYMPTSYEAGCDLARWLKDLRHAPDEATLRGIMLPLLNGLEKMHGLGLLHRDIKPANIYICADGRPMLLDFGAAREAIGSRSKSITAIISPGYAPLEQYSADDASLNGPWSDLYALGATMHCALTGKAPPEATRRTRHDPYQPLVTVLAGRYSRPLLAAIDQCLNMDERQRPQSVAAVRAMLQSERVVQRPRPITPPVRAQRPQLPLPYVAAAIVLASIGVASLAAFVWTSSRATVASADTTTPSEIPTTAPRTDLIPSEEIQKPQPPKEIPKPEPPKVAPPEIVPSSPKIAPPKDGPIRRQMDPPKNETRRPEPPKPTTPTPSGPRTIGFNKDVPFVNSLGMCLVYAGTPNVYMSAWETTVADWRTFINAQPPEGGAQPLPDNPLLPVSNLSAAQAEAFCEWLTKKEQQEGLIGTEDYYDLPTDPEWIAAATPSPNKKFDPSKFVFPWEGNQFPPSKATLANIGDVPSTKGRPAYTDPYPAAAPVRSFDAHNYGLYDMGGNAAEWTVLPTPGSSALPSSARRACLRGGGWTDNTPEAFSIYAQHSATNGAARIDSGFRCVLRIAIELISIPGAVPSTDPSVPTKRAEPVVEPTPLPMTKPVGPIGPGSATPKAAPNANAPATILLSDDLAAIASSYLRAINTGPDDRESLIQSLAPTVSYNNQVGVTAVDVVTALHSWTTSHGASGAIRLIGASSQNPGPGGSTSSWLDLSVVTGDGKARTFIQQVFFEPVTHKIFKLGAFTPNDGLTDSFRAPEMIAPGGARVDPPPASGNGQPPAKSNPKKPNVGRM